MLSRLRYHLLLTFTTGAEVRGLRVDGRGWWTDVDVSSTSAKTMGLVVNMRNSTIAVVHQYNRMQYVVKDTLGCRAPRGAAEPDYCLECRRNWNASGAVGKGATKWIRWQGK